MSVFTPLYTMDLKNNLVVCHHSGKMQHSDYLNFIKEYVKDPDVKPGLNYMVDFGTIEVVYNKIDILKLLAFLLKKRKLFKGKIAMIADTPNQVVVGKIFETIEKSNLLNFAIFSTVDAAEQWMGVEKGIGLNHLSALKNKANL